MNMTYFTMFHFMSTGWEIWYCCHFMTYDLGGNFNWQFVLNEQISRYFSDPQYYFQVNDHYVRNKLKVVLFPFLHRVSSSFTLFFSLLGQLSSLLHSSSMFTNSLLLQGHWTRITEPVGGRLSYKPPIYDINAPDLYIPFMAFGTYVILAGLSLGLRGK